MGSSAGTGSKKSSPASVVVVAARSPSSASVVVSSSSSSKEVVVSSLPNCKCNGNNLASAWKFASDEDIQRSYSVVNVLTIHQKSRHKVIQAKSEISIVLFHLIAHSRSSPSEVGTEDQGGRTPLYNTGFSSQIGTKLRDWAVEQAWGSCYSGAALSSNDSKTR